MDCLNGYHKRKVLKKERYLNYLLTILENYYSIKIGAERLFDNVSIKETDYGKRIKRSKRRKRK